MLMTFLPLVGTHGLKLYKWMMNDIPNATTITNIKQPGQGLPMCASSDRRCIGVLTILFNKVADSSKWKGHDCFSEILNHHDHLFNLPSTSSALMKKFANRGVMLPTISSYDPLIQILILLRQSFNSDFNLTWPFFYLKCNSNHLYHPLTQRLVTLLEWVFMPPPLHFRCKNALVEPSCSVMNEKPRRTTPLLQKLLRILLPKHTQKNKLC